MHDAKTIQEWVLRRYQEGNMASTPLGGTDGRLRRLRATLAADVAKNGVRPRGGKGKGRPRSTGQPSGHTPASIQAIQDMR